jgi:CBS domain-containing protein
MAEAPQKVASSTTVRSFTEETLPEIFKNTLLGALVSGEERPLVTVNADTKLTEALKLFQKNNILSAPVLDAKEKLFIGTLDLFDIMSFVAFIPYFEREDRKKQYFEIKGVGITRHNTRHTHALLFT